MAVQPDDQLALDERTITDSVLEGLLEARLRAQQDRSEISKVYKAAAEAANAAIATLNLADEDAVRVGRFRITKTAIAAHSVAFDVEEKSRISISLAEDGAAKPARARHLRSVSDDDDLRPTGDVNPDALRGAAERASDPDDLLPD
jgi:hypothetical protein